MRMILGRSFQSMLWMKLNVFFKCRTCPLSYPFDYNLMDHKDKVHKQDNKSKYMCKKCKKAFASFNALSHHVALKHFSD